MRKRSRKLEENVGGGEDIISHLPQDILHHIFSFLHIKQSIQTCILSKSWRHFWVSIPILKFTYMGGRGGYRSKANRYEFMDFVDRVLMNRDKSNIHEFVFVNLNEINVTDHLNTWIIHCVTRNVQHLTLTTHFPQKFHFQPCLFTCKSLTKLVVEAKHNLISLSLPDSISLPRLETLYLHLVKFEDEDSTNRLFSSCPILKSLTINACKFPPINVKISSPKLQHLVIRNCITLPVPLHETNFQLCAPNLISFVWYNEISIHCSPNNFSSLVKADIRSGVYEEEKAKHAPFMLKFFRGLHNVKILELNAAFLEVIAGAPDLLDSQPTKFGNLRWLKLIGHWRSVECFHGISYLLGISPNIETIFVEVTSNLAKKGDCWKAGLSFEGLLNHVKCFELHYVIGHNNELEFIESLLKNAMLLEKLLISLRIPNPCYDKDIRVTKFKKKVLTFPKASSNVIISFKYVES